MPAALRFIIIPKVAHPWFDEVNKGARAQATILGHALGIDIAVDYRPPAVCDPGAQTAILEEAAGSRPDGIAIDPVDAVDRMPTIHRVRERGIPVVLFDSPSGDSGIPSVGNNFARQGILAAERLVGRISHTGKVAVMQGYPTAPNHRERYDAQVGVLRRHPGITVVDGGTDNDDIATARAQAAAVLAAHPDLRGYLCCNASGPIGISAAVRDAGKTGKVVVVGMDGIRPILDAIRQGVIESSSATKPGMQGSMAVLLLWQASLGVALPQAIDTGIDVITRENVDRFLADAV